MSYYERLLQKSLSHYFLYIICLVRKVCGIMNVVYFPKLSNISRKKTEPLGREDTHTHAIAFLHMVVRHSCPNPCHFLTFRAFVNFYKIDQPSKILGKIIKNKLIYKVVVGLCTGQIRVTTIYNKIVRFLIPINQII